MDEEKQERVNLDEVNGDLYRSRSRTSIQATSLNGNVDTPSGPDYPLTDLSRGLVGWESQTDPANPQNWPTSRKAWLLVFMSIVSTLSPMASTLAAPGLLLAMADLHETSTVVGSFMITIYILGFGIGPLFLGPLSEIYGRYPVVVASTWTMNAFLMGCALAPTMPGIIVMRFIAGIGGSGAMIISPAIVADLYPLEQRAFWSSIIVLAQCAAPAVGPICGGFIAQYLGWRWGYWILFICSSSVTVLMTIFMRECYAPRILFTKAEKMKKETGRTDLRPLLNQEIPKNQLLARSIIRPTKMLTRSPVVFVVCSYVAVIYGMLYLMFTTIPDVFHGSYGWSTDITGLAYTPLGVGMVVALLLIMKTNDARVMKLTKKNNNVFEAEFRLASTVWYAALPPIALFWYGWSIEKQAHWSAPILSFVAFGFGMLGIFLPCQTYLIDAWPTYAASAVSTTRTMVSLSGAFLPLAGPPLYHNLGLGWGNTTLGLIALVLTPIPALLYRYGKFARAKYPIQL